MNQRQNTNDPIGSPHPLPWNWVLSTHERVSSTHGFGTSYYRSGHLISPDGAYAAYAQVEMQVDPKLHRSSLRSRLFVENRQTGEVQRVVPTSPIATSARAAIDATQMRGTISLTIPLSWSRGGDRLLARQFEGLFCSSEATDYAVVWDGKQKRSTTLAPKKLNGGCAVLLGWSQAKSDRVLFRAGGLGLQERLVCAVDLGGSTVAANDDRPLLFGNPLNAILDSSQVAPSF
ncbi:MAG: hypothetical protein SWY16_22105 [Cyanobacteriota bacterium]|nr:hypothetical protein [Cyanobacteriota bacterium]